MQSSLAIDLQWFSGLARPFLAKARGPEVLSISGQVDQCEFVRLNGARIVQASQVDHVAVSLGLRKGAKSVGCGLSLSPNLTQAADQLSHQLAQLRSLIDHVPDDPFLEQWAPASQTIDQTQGSPTPVAQVVEDLTAMAQGLDLVGLYAAGPLSSFMATSDGHFHWHQTFRSFLDFSVYALKDKAIKSSWSGSSWSAAQVRQKIELARSQIEILYRPAMSLTPGSYRTLLSAEAVSDLLGLACWGGFSARAHLTGQSPLGALRQGERHLSPLVSLGQDLKTFGIPRVQGSGHLRPEQTTLISEGRYVDWLCSPRTALEFDVAHNAASEGETPASLVLAPGSLSVADSFDALDEGIYISNVWYLNYSDRQAGRFTGMTRFASLWVEQGRAVAPIAPMRFDDSFYSALGSRLVALGNACERFDEVSTYGARSLGGAQTPLALLDALHFAL